MVMMMTNALMENPKTIQTLMVLSVPNFGTEAVTLPSSLIQMNSCLISSNLIVHIALHIFLDVSDIPDDKTDRKQFVLRL